MWRTFSTLMENPGELRTRDLIAAALAVNIPARGCSDPAAEEGMKKPAAVMLRRVSGSYTQELVGENDTPTRTLVRRIRPGLGGKSPVDRTASTVLAPAEKIRTQRPR